MITCKQKKKKIWLHQRVEHEELFLLPKTNFIQTKLPIVWNIYVCGSREKHSFRLFSVELIYQQPACIAQQYIM